MIAFGLHALFPFIGIDRTLDLEATIAFLDEQNDWIEAQHTPGDLPSMPDAEMQPNVPG